MIWAPMRRGVVEDRARSVVVMDAEGRVKEVVPAMVFRLRRGEACEPHGRRGCRMCVSAERGRVRSYAILRARREGR